MKLIDGFWWPDRDRKCFKVAHKLGDLDRAVSFCARRRLAVQAGGNVGVWPRHLSGLFEVVHTFEPSDENWECLLLNIVEENVIRHKAALLDFCGEVGMTFNPQNCGDDRTVEGTGHAVVTIDSLGLEPDLIYLDVQGDEIPALEGARETIARCRPVIGVEVHDAFVTRHWDPRKWLEKAGYALHEGRRDYIATVHRAA